MDIKIDLNIICKFEFLKNIQFSGHLDKAMFFLLRSYKIGNIWQRSE